MLKRTRRVRRVIDVAVLGAAGLFLVHCHNDDQGSATGGPDREVGTGGGGGSGGGSCADPTFAPVVRLFATTCAGTSCHSNGPGGQFPPLVDEPASAWIDEKSHASPNASLVVPGHPEQSFLYLKLTGAQGPSGGALMPLGAAMPIAQADLVRAWIAAGAPSDCGAPGGPDSTDPNKLDQASLFTCPANHPPPSSPARIRRIDSPELTVSIPEALNGFNGQPGGTKGYLNPFRVLPPIAYSTYSLGQTIDTPTLDLYFEVLPEVARTWSHNDPATAGGFRVVGINDDGKIACMIGTGPKLESSPTDACIDTFLDRYLSMGLLFRAPTKDERAEYRQFLVTLLKNETDVSNRPATLGLFEQGAWLTAGALFRSEEGAGATDATGRTMLTADELALTLGGMLSYHRPGAAMLASGAGRFTAPEDPDDSCHPWLHLIAEAAKDGSLRKPDKIKELFRQYGGGTDPGGGPLACTKGTSGKRRDLGPEVDNRRLRQRGEYWLAPRIIGFFREWLGYAAGDTSFKDAPGRSSRFDLPGDPDRVTESTLDPTGLGFTRLQNQLSSENNLTSHLDDTIARVVVESAKNGKDVFEELMTTRTWRLPSDRVGLGTVSCDPAQNGPMGANPACGACTGPDSMCACNTVKLADHTKLTGCGVRSAALGALMARVYNLESIPDDEAARWVDMSETERMGVLTHPAWLSAHGDNFQDDASLVHRGKWIRERLFCETVPGLELVMVQAKLNARQGTFDAPPDSARDRVSQAIDANATCHGCHRLMNPLGLPFEMYNHAGFLRAWDKLLPDPGGKLTVLHTPDATSTIDNLPDQALDGAYQNAIDFARKVSKSQYARRCFIRQAFRYFMGRDETMADQCTLTAMEASLAQGSFVDMLATLAASDTVQYRTQGAAQ